MRELLMPLFIVLPMYIVLAWFWPPPEGDWVEPSAAFAGIPYRHVNGYCVVFSETRGDAVSFGTMNADPLWRARIRVIWMNTVYYSIVRCFGIRGRAELRQLIDGIAEVSGARYPQQRN